MSMITKGGTKIILYHIDYIRGGIIWKTSPFMSLDDCKREMKRFNTLPFMSLERGAMTAEIAETEV